MLEDETVRKRTSHPSSYAEAKKMKSLTLQSDYALALASDTALLPF